MFKRIAAPVLLIFFIIALNAADIDNGRIKISFEEKYGAVTFSYLKELGGKNYLPLIFSEDPRTTQFNLLVNNQVFNVAESFDFEPSFENLGKSGRYTWRSKQLEIVQEVSFLSSANAPLADGVMLKFTIKNISSQRLAVGLRYLIDTYLGEGKQSHFLNDYASPINHETGFTSTSAPKYILSPYNNSPDKGLMIMLRSPGVTLPDSAVCANWKRLSDSAWDYAVNTSRNFSRPPYSINDSAVLLNYQPGPLTPGAERSIVLALGYYAPGGFSPSLAEGNEKIGNLVASLSEEDPAAASGKGNPEAELAAVRELISQVDDLLAAGEEIPEEKLLLLRQLMDTLKTRREKFTE